jgi:hypothetical protein
MTPTEARARANTVHSFTEAAEIIRSLADQVEALHTENATLRELVREALVTPFAVTREWYERAEKALATGPSRPPGA